jgi:hypothetical protein
VHAAPTTAKHSVLCLFGTVCRHFAEGGPGFVFMPVGADFAERAIALARELLPAHAQAAAWRQQVGIARKGWRQLYAAMLRS